MFSLVVEAEMSGVKNTYETQEQIYEALASEPEIIGAPDRIGNIGISQYTGCISFSFQLYLTREIPEIKRRLADCDGIDQKTLKIFETIQRVH